MLGRLKMDVDECIASYNDLIRVVFGEKSRMHQSKFNLRGQTQARFDSNMLESAVEKTIRDRGLSPTDKMLEDDTPSCKVFVCAISKSSTTTYRLRSYHTYKTSINATICQAARATSAATTFFDPVSIEDMEFVDGALGANNPVEQVEEEATELWCPETGNIKPLVKCFISIGTGNMGTYDINDRLDKFMTTLAKMTTDAERIAESSMRRWRQHYDQSRYFRFNVEHGLKPVGMKEYRKKGEIQAATYRYLDSQVQSMLLRKCVENLVLKQKSAGPHLERLISSQPQRLQPDLISRQSSPEGYADEPLYRSSHADIPSMPCFSVPMKVSPTFIPRDEYTNKLYASFSRDCHQRAALVGLAGTGKTQIALHFADNVHQQYPNYPVFWISAAGLQESCNRIARELNLFKIYEHEYSRPDPRVLLCRYLEAERVGRWDLIIDDVDDYDPLPTLPRSSQGRILFITRSMKVATAAVGNQVGQVIKVEGLNSETSLSLFQNLLFNKDLSLDANKTGELLAELENLPLAISHAARYLNDNPQLTVDQLLKSLKSGDSDALSFIAKEYSESAGEATKVISISGSFSRSFRALRKQHQEAWAILEFVSRIDSRSIPRSLLNVEGKSGLEASIGILCSSFVLRTNPGGQSYDIPTVIYLSTRVWQQQNNSSRQLTKLATKRLNKLTPDDKPSDRLLWEKYRTHVTRVLQDCKHLKMDFDERFELAAKAGLWLVRQRDLEGAATLLEQAFSRFHKSEPKSSRRLRVQINLAETYSEIGQAPKAIKLAGKAIKVYEKNFSKDDAALVAVSCALSKGYRFNKEPEKGISCLEALSRISGKRSPKSKFALTTELGKCWVYKENFEKAIEALRVAVSVAKDKLPPDDTSLLIAKNHLANAYLQNELVKESIPIFEEVLPIEQKVFGKSHKETLYVRARLAEAYSKAGETEKAVRQWEELVVLQRENLGKIHERTMFSENSLARAYYEGDDKNKALRLLESMVCVRRECSDETDAQRKWAEEFWERCIQDWKWTWTRR
ncbi:uncharacterized protein FIESC28_08729 [Fusarium coffeatum]|uniref:PNPLA domain-containing protein n=1 Tax=Fusarium coffeatum TaxID=231269 RepID=A0A366R533_9HYPO|nr:uncharacterized protein FIESC28_08729 [Fusarium coffeatum]RBR12243.1 hypothetical protein FIESC28_08729 [Fusarium coffeatum]